MWANAQCDGHPAEYRGHPLFNATKFGWRPMLECMPSFILIRPSIWPQYTNVTDTTDRSDRQGDSTGRTVLQMVAQKQYTVQAH